MGEAGGLRIRVPVLAFFVALLVAPPALAIYGGEDAPEGAYPFMVHVFQKGDPSDNDASGGFICGGFLVAPTVVATSGHCMESVADRVPVVGGPVSGGPYERPQALIGATDRSQPGEVIDVVAMRQHPRWMVGPGFGVNDVGVFLLASRSAHAPVRMAAPGDEALYAAGTPATAIGWGWTETFETLPDRLQQVTVPVHDDLDCKLRPQYVVLFDPATQVCAGEPGKDSCGGDSGGPLLVEHAGAPLVVGIVTYGSQTADCADDLHPGVYTEVAAHRDFFAPYLDG